MIGGDVLPPDVPQIITRHLPKESSNETESELKFVKKFVLEDDDGEISKFFYLYYCSLNIKLTSLFSHSHQ